MPKEAGKKTINAEANPTKVGGIVLCGGKSTRMGQPKATLPFGPELMLQRMVRILGESVSPIVVVAAQDQDLPSLPDDVLVARDREEDRGPLEGILAGLQTIRPHAEAAFVTSCDVPLLSTAFVRHVVSLLPGHEVVVPKEERYHHPLASAYSTDVIESIRDLLDNDRMRPVFLYERVATLEVPVEQLRAVDPDLDSLRNLNTPEQYLAALKLAGYEPDPNIVSNLNQE